MAVQQVLLDFSVFRQTIISLYVSSSGRARCKMTKEHDCKSDLMTKLHCKPEKRVEIERVKWINDSSEF
mgnify:CR=1 FL=1